MNNKIKKNPLILLVNDDGIFSPGLTALCEAIESFGTLLIVAPDRQQTSMGRSYPKVNDLGVIKKVKIKTSNKNFMGYSITASPAYAVAYAVKEICEQKPDLCISGINYGENLGKTISYSGTIGAVLQAADFDIPSIAISRPTTLETINSKNYLTLDWTNSKKVIAYWVCKVLEEGFPFNAPILNINVPESKVDVKDYNFTFQSKKELFEFIKPEYRKFEYPYQLPSKKRTNFDDIENGSDIYTVCVENRISVTPIECDFTFKDFYNLGN